MSISDLNSELEKQEINIESSEEYNVSLLIEVKDELPFNGENLLASEIDCEDDINQDLFEHRRKVKEYYISHNKEIAEKLSLNKYEYSVSFFAPYIDISFDDLLEYSSYENDLIDTLQNNKDLICSATVSIVLTKDNATVNNSNYEQAYSVEQAYYDIGVFQAPYTGEGIKVGTIEPGAPHTDEYLKPDKYVFLRETRAPHCTAVTSIIGGYYGIAKDVYLYCLPMSDSVIDDLNILISLYDVNIVNMSSSYQICGYYFNWDSCVDKIIANTGCTVVIAAGNLGNTQSNADLLVTPACSMNAITVGSIDCNGNISSFSS